LLTEPDTLPPPRRDRSVAASRVMVEGALPWAGKDLGRDRRDVIRAVMSSPASVSRSTSAGIRGSIQKLSHGARDHGTDVGHGLELRQTGTPRAVIEPERPGATGRAAFADVNGCQSRRGATSPRPYSIQSRGRLWRHSVSPNLRVIILASAFVDVLMSVAKLFPVR